MPDELLFLDTTKPAGQQRTFVSDDEPLPVALGAVGGLVAVPSANFTRPADTAVYAANDLVANSTVAGSVVPLSFTVARAAGGTGSIRRARLKKSGASVTNASFRLHLYRTLPTVTNGDNGVWLSIHANYLGAIDIVADRAFSDAAGGEGVPTVGGEITFDLPDGQSVVYGLLAANLAYTPLASEVFTVSLEVYQD